MVLLAKLVHLPEATLRDAAAIRVEFDIGHVLRPQAILG